MNCEFEIETGDCPGSGFCSWFKLNCLKHGLVAYFYSTVEYPNVEGWAKIAWEKHLAEQAAVEPAGQLPVHLL